jgi:hypothetical protein
MPVLRDFNIEIDPAEIIQRQSSGEPKPALIEATGWAIERALELVEPQVAYNILKSEGVRDEELLIGT